MLVLSRRTGHKVRIGNDILTVLEINKYLVVVEFQGKELILRQEKMLKLDNQTSIIYKRQSGNYAKIGFISTKRIVRQELYLELNKNLRSP